MTESEAHQVLMLRAVETAALEQAQAGWSREDADWSSADARRQVGEAAADEAFIVRRARSGLQRLRERGIGLQAGAPLPAWWPLSVLGLALFAGLAVDALGPVQRINLLAPPRLALLLWNLLVFAGLLVAAVRGMQRSRRAGPATEPSVGRFAAWLVHVGGGIARRLGSHDDEPWVARARLRAHADWAVAGRAVHGQRVAALLHTAAAMVALGVVLSMYLHGLVLDYRAGWDSTFAGAAEVRALLGIVLGPAAAISGIELPAVATLAGLRWADGSAGEGAARWIHLYALTLVGVIVLPRLLLALWAAVRARRYAGCIRLPLDEPYFLRLLHAARATPRPVTVLPYSYQLGAAEQAGLQAALAGLFGPGAQLRLAESLPLGAEDDLANAMPVQRADAVVALFAMTATPEREAHGAFVRALARALPPSCTLQVVVDESGFRRKLGVASDAQSRIHQRRIAWERLFQDLALPPPHFVDLTSGSSV